MIAVAGGRPGRFAGLRSRRDGVRSGSTAGAVCVLVVCLLIIGCASEDRRSADVDVSWNVSPAPAAVGSTTVEVNLTDDAGRPLERADVTLEATMTHPGMRPERAEAIEVSPGTYEGVLHLTMSGDWVLLLDAILADGSRLQRQHQLSGVRRD